MTEISLQCRIEFALRDAGFNLDDAALLAKRAAATPVLPLSREPVAWMRLQQDPLFSVPTVLLTQCPEDHAPGTLVPLYVADNCARVGGSP